MYLRDRSSSVLSEFPHSCLQGVFRCAVIRNLFHRTPFDGYLGHFQSFVFKTYAAVNILLPEFAYANV